MENKLWKKGLVLGIIVLFIGAGIIPSISGTIGNLSRRVCRESTGTLSRDIIYVDNDSVYPGNGTIWWPYRYIWQGIENASVGDTIYVYNGTYYENVVVNKTINLTGEDRNSTIIASAGYADVVYISISADWVNISGFTIRNGESNCNGIGVRSNFNSISDNNIISNNYLGIYVYYSNNNTISNNNISNNDVGIRIEGSNNNNISGNIISSNNNHGIYLFSASNNNIIIGNNVTENDVQGIRIEQSSFNIISDNEVKENIDDGINLYFHAFKNTISGNIIKNNNDDGIQLYDSCDNNNISNNTITDSGDEGIFLYDSSNNIISGNDVNSIPVSTIGIFLDYSNNNNILTNVVSNNYHGIEFHRSNNNFIIGNNLTFNNNSGVWLRYSSNNNRVYNNNFINNTWGGNPNAVDECSNVWDNGYPSGGNYWSDYNGTDDDGDGIGDMPYPIPGGDNKDRYPFMKPYGWINSAPNIPDRPSGEIIGGAGIKYKYTTSTTDPDNDLVWYKWDWGDESYSDWLGPYDSGEKASANQSWSDGKYQIRVKAKDIRNQESNWSEPLEITIINPGSLKTVILFGRIANLCRSSDYSMFNAVKLLWISINPPGIDLLISNETIVISNKYFGILTDSFICGIFKAMELDY